MTPKDKADWFDKHVVVLARSEDTAEKIKVRLRQEIARKYGHPDNCECRFCRAVTFGRQYEE